jgi:RecA/RadA recombinase
VPTKSYIATSIARRLIARMQATHQRQRISVFAGPPGIGKTTAIDAFAARASGGLAVVKVARRSAREVLALQHVLDSVQRLNGTVSTEFPASAWHLRNALFAALCKWADADPASARRGEYPSGAFPHLTVVFDEAQNLSRSAIEALRYWNDPDRCYAPFPLGLIFVGNSEFSLQSDIDGQSAISAAVADRALYVQTFDYEDVTDDDLRLFLEDRGVFDPGAVAALLRYFRTARAARSLRQVRNLLDELAAVSRRKEVTADTVRQVLGGA